MKIQAIHDYVYDLANTAAQDGFSKLVNNQFTSFYFAFAPGKIEIISQEESTPAGMELYGERLPRGVTVESLRGWFIDRFRCLPILPIDLK
jgi:hypothetical protein